MNVETDHTALQQAAWRHRFHIARRARSDLEQATTAVTAVIYETGEAPHHW
jgi:hypothetical protein